MWHFFFLNVVSNELSSVELSCHDDKQHRNTLDRCKVFHQYVYVNVWINDHYERNVYYTSYNGMDECPNVNVNVYLTYHCCKKERMKFKRRERERKGNVTVRNVLNKFYMNNFAIHQGDHNDCQQLQIREYLICHLRTNYQDVFDNELNTWMNTQTESSCQFARWHKTYICRESNCCRQIWHGGTFDEGRLEFASWLSLLNLIRVRRSFGRKNEKVSLPRCDRCEDTWLIT